MPDTTIEDLRQALDRQREEQEARHQALLDQLRTPARPRNAAEQESENRRLMSSSLAANAAEREAAKRGEDGGDA